MFGEWILVSMLLALILLLGWDKVCKWRKCCCVLAVCAPMPNSEIWSTELWRRGKVLIILAGSGELRRLNKSPRPPPE